MTVQLLGLVNAGYEIIDAIAHPSRHPYDAGRLWYVLGESEGQYVTWLYNAESAGFCSGHYFMVDSAEDKVQRTVNKANALQKAVVDLYHRAGA